MYNTILIFDSGVGGLSIYKKIKGILPQSRYIYVFDNEFFPYGEKSEEVIINRSKIIINTMYKVHKLDLIIIACNTVSVLILEELRKIFNIPIIGVIPSIETAVKLTKNCIVGLLATNITINHNYTNNLIKKFSKNCKILKFNLSKLANIAEDKLHGKAISNLTLKNIMSPLLRIKDFPDTIILGCTHFSFLHKELKSILPKNINLIDSKISMQNKHSLIIKNFINSKRLKFANEENTAYCITKNSRTKLLIPILKSYGFNLLKEVKI